MPYTNIHIQMVFPSSKLVERMSNNICRLCSSCFSFCTSRLCVDGAGSGLDFRGGREDSWRYCSTNPEPELSLASGRAGRGAGAGESMTEHGWSGLAARGGDWDGCPVPGAVRAD